MHATGITANLSVADIAEARDFYVGFLGLSVEDSTWAGRQPPFSRWPRGRPVSHAGCNVTGRRRDLCSRRRRGRSGIRGGAAPWLRHRSSSDDRAVGVRRFLVRAPDGNVIDIVNHKDEDS